MHEETLASGMRVWSVAPDGDGPFPAAVIFHERRGPVAHTFRMAERMSEEGFAVFVPDMFHRYTEDRGPVEGGEVRVDMPDEETLEDWDELVAYIHTLDHADADRVVAAGFCQTGRTPLVIAAHRSNLSGAIVFHGGIYDRDFEVIGRGEESVVGLTPRVSSPVLGVFGELDFLVPLPNVWRFRRMLEEHRKSYQIHLYPAAHHSWMDEAAPDRYNAEATEQAWRLLGEFSREVTSGAWPLDQLVFRFESGIQPDQEFLPAG